jgi:hypothetical protein
MGGHQRNETGEKAVSLFTTSPSALKNLRLYLFGPPHSQLSVWSRGMIPASGAGGPGFDPRNGPFSLLECCFCPCSRPPPLVGRDTTLSMVDFNIKSSPGKSLCQFNKLRACLINIPFFVLSCQCLIAEIAACLSSELFTPIVLPLIFTRHITSMG